MPTEPRVITTIVTIRAFTTGILRGRTRIASRVSARTISATSWIGLVMYLASSRNFLALLGVSSGRDLYPTATVALQEWYGKICQRES